jgi:hypothetical protein
MLPGLNGPQMPVPQRACLVSRGLAERLVYVLKAGQHRITPTVKLGLSNHMDCGVALQQLTSVLMSCV